MTRPLLLSAVWLGICYPLATLATPLPPIFNPISPTTAFELSEMNRLWQNQWRFKNRREASTTLQPSPGKVLQIEVDGQLLTPSQAQQLLLRQE
ncbi:MULTISPECIES: hypothetical protein [unclassified Thermosynechococcus]|uniref:hypothetical protein n=1 Tax=unclassified Thermosynechococcus TaxID=2622553 RepID=UPI0019F84A9E|nr:MULTISPECIES: hypothetical protein [unclassified Thermosynechococcus]HIK36193.1 hypothetical protein [Thermosynechococcus sp. M98_K2018_005]HIK47745.1 hypothetical protein [Thermosynechococcus sp. M55_K2018_012]